MSPEEFDVYWAHRLAFSDRPEARIAISVTGDTITVELTELVWFPRIPAGLRVQPSVREVRTADRRHGRIICHRAREYRSQADVSRCYMDAEPDLPRYVADEARERYDAIVGGR